MLFVLLHYSHLFDIAYYFSTGADLMPQVDSSVLDPMIAQIVEMIRPLALEIEPYAKQLWAHLEE
jgi:hypothetical protein